VTFAGHRNTLCAHIPRHAPLKGLPCAIRH
jgi:hypothetical protein